MATMQVRDVPDDVAELITAKARAENQSVSAYLRELLAQHVHGDRLQREHQQWSAELQQAHERLGLPNASTTPTVEVVREVREEYERGQA